MPGPDLTRARATVERLLDDTATVTRDTQQMSDDELDLVTGLLGAPVGDSATVWTGPVLIRTANLMADGLAEQTAADADPDRRQSYVALVPLSAPSIKPGDLLRITGSRRDAQLIGQHFRAVSDGLVSTYTVVRQVAVERL